MSFQMLNENNTPDPLANDTHELHAKTLEHDSEVTESRTSWVQKHIPRHLPWRGLAETSSSKDTPVTPVANMDTMPVQYELHSNTKSHQLGGIYESYSMSE